jgi:uncharacterized protein (TIGR03790 family)
MSIHQQTRQMPQVIRGIARPHRHQVLRSTRALLSAIILVCYGDGGSLVSMAVGLSANAAQPTLTRSPLTLAMPTQGLSANELAVIVDQNDPLSEAIASYYQSARGVPAANIIRVALPTRPAPDAISTTDFALLKADIDAKLPANVQATLLAWNAPSRVVGSCSMGITSAMAFGYDPKYCAGACAATAASTYFDSESSRPWTDHGMRPSMMLGASNLAAAKSLIDRGVASDATYPAGDGYLLRTNDAARSVRYGDYVGLPALWSANGGLALNYIDNSAGAASNSVRGKNQVLFYFTGLVTVPDLATNRFAPGAAADHLTSFGGHLPSGNGQMPITAWLNAGATASYGAVEEPCNFTQKFSKASVLIDQYYRGATLMEAYWKSVQWPGQGLFVGEPLAKPFRDTLQFAIFGNQYLIRTRAMRPHASYALEYRTGASATWVRLASFRVVRAQAQTVNAPLAPGNAVQLRWVGPCPINPTQTCVLGSSG